MKKTLFLLSLLMVIMISGCATEQGGAGGYESPSGGHAGHHH